MCFRDPQIQIHSSTFLHFYTYMYYAYVYPLFQMIVMLFKNISTLFYLSFSFKSPSFILLMLSNGPPSSISLAPRWSRDSLRWIARSVHYLFIYLFMLWCQCFNCWQSSKFNMGRLNYLSSKLNLSRRGRMIVEFATTCAIVAYHHYWMLELFRQCAIYLLILL